MLHQAETLIAKSCYHGDGIRQWATAVEKRYKDFARRMQKYRAKLENKLGYTVSEHEVWRSLSYFLLLTQPPLPDSSVCSPPPPPLTPFFSVRLNKRDSKSKGQTNYEVEEVFSPIPLLFQAPAVLFVAGLSPVFSQLVSLNRNCILFNCFCFCSFFFVEVKDWKYSHGILLKGRESELEKILPSIYQCPSQNIHVQYKNSFLYADLIHIANSLRLVVITTNFLFMLEMHLLCIVENQQLDWIGILLFITSVSHKVRWWNFDQVQKRCPTRSTCQIRRMLQLYSLRDFPKLFPNS